eukprot:TRINITY_DN473_c0_g1_i16.p1 TRINITY_DN473_c0_g1~~TRINITY_DN473_c0_g1_i16.p1  ORF type:complete len:650 (+),score=212.22 TRINITY_DN473_c0_g1_i16:49-1950(+)
MCIRDSLKGYVEKGAITYFTFSVNRQRTNILISLTPLNDGDPDLVVDKGIDSRPTAVNYRWAGETFKSEQLHILPEDFNKNETMMSDYVVGVIGYTDCTFLINVVFTERQIFDVVAGIPYEFSIRPGNTVYLQYYNIYEDDFQLNFLRDVGTVSIAVKNMLLSERYEDRLPSKENSDWFKDHSIAKRDVINIKRNDKGFCFGCYFLIGISTSEAKGVKLSFFAKVHKFHVNLQNGKPFEDFIDDPKFPNRYTYEVTVPQNLHVDVLVHYGDPVFYIATANNYMSNDETKALYQLTGRGKQGLRHQHLRLIVDEKSLRESMTCSLNPSKDCVASTQLYITAKDSSDSAYQITVRSPDSLTILRDGLHFFGHLEPGETQQFVFYSLDTINADQMMSIIVKRSIDSPSHEVPDLSAMYEVWNRTRNGVNISAENTTPVRHPAHQKFIYEAIEGVRIDQIKLEKGRYLINITNPWEGLIKFSIVVHARELLSLPVNASHVSILREGTSHFYEFLPYSDGEFLIKTRQCLGVVNVHAASSYEKLAEGNYDLKLKNYDNEDRNVESVAKLDVKSRGKPVYIAVKFFTGLLPYKPDMLLRGMLPPREAMYRIQSSVISNDKARGSRRHFVAGGNLSLIHI